jgi:hypothetical protein
MDSDGARAVSSRRILERERRVAERYAIYFVPDVASPLWQAASAILGYDAATGLETPFPPASPCDRPDWPDVVAEARRYGFHATIKAPFELAAGRSEAELRERLDGFCRERAAMTLPVDLGSIEGFLAITPNANAAIGALERDAVIAFEPFRAPLSEADRARRLRTPLTPRQTEYLDAYGYPFVFEEFRFHMTLTARLPVPDRMATAMALRALLPPLPMALPVDRLALFRQPDRAARFAIAHVARFGR